MLWLAKRVIFGETKNPGIKSLKDINFFEGTTLFLLASAIIVFGFYPDPLLNTLDISINNLIDKYETDLNFYLTMMKSKIYTLIDLLFYQCL